MGFWSDSVLDTSRTPSSFQFCRQKMQYDLLHRTKKLSARDPEAFLSALRGIPHSKPKFHWRSRYQQLLIPGQGCPEETSLELQCDSGQGDFRGYHTMAVFPVWWLEVTTLAAETCPTPELPIIEVLTTTQYEWITANSEAHRLGGKRHIHTSAFSATLTQGQSRAAEWETSGNIEVISVGNICPRPPCRQRVQAHLLPGLWAGTVVGGMAVDHLQKSPAQSQAPCWYCHRPY